jgi:hypothetical protein
MKRVVVAGFALSLLAAPVFAASAKVESAIKEFKAVAADASKLKIFCSMTKVMDAAGEKPTPAQDEQITGFLKQLGANFETAWNVGADLNETSADGKAYNAASDDLAGKCT